MIVAEEYSINDSGSKSRCILHSDGTLTKATTASTSYHHSFIKDVFLPAGWPHSVTPDYAWFQVWDTVQALCSYIRGMLTTHALLVGVGVGQSSATPWSAALQFFLRDFLGMLGGVVFAALHGSSFDSKAKQWRLTADVANDIGLAAELIAPVFSQQKKQHVFLLLVCFGSLCRAITGVAGGATRFALTQHFALQGNAADIAAKESSQETATTLIGMVLGVGLTKLSNIHQPAAWVAFWIITALHIWANVKALRCLRLETLNRDRLDIILQEERVSTPAEMSLKESLMPPPLAWLLCRLKLRSQSEPNIIIAPSLYTLLSLSPSIGELIAKATTASQEQEKENKYIVLLLPSDSDIHSRQSKTAIVLLHRDAESVDVIKGYCAATLMLQKRHHDTAVVDNILKNLQIAGWNIDSAALLQGESRLEWAHKDRNKDDGLPEPPSLYQQKSGGGKKVD